jgi:hypothetical protein
VHYAEGQPDIFAYATTANRKRIKTMSHFPVCGEKKLQASQGTLFFPLKLLNNTDLNVLHGSLSKKHFFNIVSGSSTTVHSRYFSCPPFVCKFSS